MSEKNGHLTLLRYMNDQWVSIVETGRESTIISQVVVAGSDEFPHERVSKLIEGGRRIIQIAYGQKTWVVLMQESKGDPEGTIEQRVAFYKDFPNTEIQQAWKDGRRVQFIDYLDEQWVLVTETSRSNLVVGQTAVSAQKELPGEFLQKDIWDKDRNLTCLSFEKSVGWVLIGDGREGQGQAYTAGTDWPKEKILARLNDRMVIADVAWSTVDKAWAIVFNQTPKELTIGTAVHFDKTFNEDLMRTLRLTRYGTRF